MCSSPSPSPTGFQENSADDLHTAVYRQGSREALEMNTVRFNDDYTVVNTIKGGFSKLGYSFIIGILASIMAYCLGLPLGVLMALKKDTIVDTLGKLYTVFIIAVPSLAYIFIFKGIGGAVLEEAISLIYREFGVRPIACGVHRENHRAARFYEKHGFHRTDAMEGNDFYFLRYPGTK